MEWLAVLPGHPRVTLRDPTSARYSVGGMNFWLDYGRTAVHDYFVYEARRKAGLDIHILRGKIRLGGKYVKRSAGSVIKPWFKIERSVWEDRMGWVRIEAAHLDAILPPYKQEEQNGSIGSGEAELEA